MEQKRRVATFPNRPVIASFSYRSDDPSCTCPFCEEARATRREQDALDRITKDRKRERLDRPPPLPKL